MLRNAAFGGAFGLFLSTGMGARLDLADVTVYAVMLACVSVCLEYRAGARRRRMQRAYGAEVMPGGPGGSPR